LRPPLRFLAPPRQNGLQIYNNILHSYVCIKLLCGGFDRHSYAGILFDILSDIYPDVLSNAYSHMFFFRHTFLVYIPQGWSETNATVCGYGMLCWNFETLTWQVGNPWICHLLIGVINIYQPATVRGIILQVPSKPHARQTVIIPLKQPYFGRVTCIYSIIRDVAGSGCDQIHPNIHCPINSVYFHLKTQFTCTHKITLYVYIYICMHILIYPIWQH